MNIYEISESPLETISKNETGTKQERIFLLGYLLLTVTTLLYAIEEISEIERLKDNLAVFFIHYFIALAYVFILMFNRSFGLVKSWKRENIHKTIILLNIFLVSA